jgi:hypothetical protein
MTRVGMILLAVSMLAAGGTLEVLRSGSRVDAATIRLLQSRLEGTPQTVGEWVGRDRLYDQKMLDRAESQAHLCRWYKHPASGEIVEVLVLAGNPQAIGAHDPTVCFRGNGLLQQRKEEPRKVGPDEFWTARFKSDAPPMEMEVFWAWGTQGRWTAPDNPRFVYGSEPLLLKIYVSRVTGGPNPTEKFLDVFLPKLKAALDPAAP